MCTYINTHFVNSNDVMDSFRKFCKYIDKSNYVYYILYTIPLYTI